jgi:hypothetical protein
MNNRFDCFETFKRFFPSFDHFLFSFVTMENENLSRLEGDNHSTRDQQQQHIRPSLDSSVVSTGRFASCPAYVDDGG